MKNSIDEIITAYAEFNVYCDELSQTQADIMPALTKDMKVFDGRLYPESKQTLVSLGSGFLSLSFRESRDTCKLSQE